MYSSVMCAVERSPGFCGAWSVIALALGVATLSGCSSAYQPELFLLDASRAKYPVMLSSIPRSGPGEALTAHAEMRSDSMSTSSRYGNMTVTATTTTRGTSPRNVSEDLALQVPLGARWVQIGRLVYTGDDLLQSLGFMARRASKREIDVEGTIHR